VFEMVRVHTPATATASLTNLVYAIPLPLST